jgi:3-hydroxybutyryl-CoA dehydrogenase
MMASHKHDDSVSVVGILGSGVIGASWASLFLARGMQVDLFDAAPDVAATTNAFIRRAWPQLRELDLVETGLDIEDALVRLTICDTAAAAVYRARFVQESVPERMPVKHAIYAEIEPVLRPDAVVSTSSSGLLLGDMQQGWKDPSRFILGHPFNPPHLIPLVELLGNEKTSDGVLEFAAAFYERCGKETIFVRKEVPAHVANRLQAAVWREAIHLVAEGVASVGDVDKAMRAGPGLRWSVMGPHMLFSLGSGGLGLDGFCARYGDSFHTWWDSLGSPRLTPEIAAMLADGVADEEAGRSFEELVEERDRKLIAAITAMKDI